MLSHEQLLREAVRLAQVNRERAGRPFGAVVAMGGEIVATGVNEVAHTHDLTAHAEMQALRAACRHLQRSNLKGSTVYASGHPCPMCLAAIVLAQVDAIYYAFDNSDAAPYGLSSDAAYQALRVPLEPAPLPLTKLAIGVDAAELYA